MPTTPAPIRDPAPMLERALDEWGGNEDLWVFGYGSLIWRPDFEFVEKRDAKVFGWHRALKMWSRVNRGTPECPGLVFGMLSGGSCKGLIFRVNKAHGHTVMINLWQREMVMGVYDPRWLDCHTSEGPVKSLAFTLSRKSPNHTGVLSGKFGTTHDYALATHEQLLQMGIEDRALARWLSLPKQQT